MFQIRVICLLPFCDVQYHVDISRACEPRLLARNLPGGKASFSVRCLREYGALRTRIAAREPLELLQQEERPDEELTAANFELMLRGNTLVFRHCAISLKLNSVSQFVSSVAGLVVD